MKKISYALGMNLAQSLKSSGIETVEYDAFAKGLKSALDGGDTEMTSEEANMVLLV